MSKISKLTNELKRTYKPVVNIADPQSLQDNFIYSLLINSQYGEEIQGFSPVELSSWLQDKQLKTDFDIFNMLFGE